MDNNGQYYDTDIYMDNTYDLTLCKCLEDIGIFRCFMIQRQGLCIDHGPWFAVQRCTLFIFSRYYRQYLEAKLILTALFRLNRDVKRKQLGASYFPRCWDLRFPQLIRSVFHSIRRRASDRGISLSKPWRSYYEIAIITVEPSPWPGNSTCNSATSIQKYR